MKMLIRNRTTQKKAIEKRAIQERAIQAFEEIVEVRLLEGLATELNDLFGLPLEQDDLHNASVFELGLLVAASLSAASKLGLLDSLTVRKRPGGKKHKIDLSQKSIVQFLTQADRDALLADVLMPAGGDLRAELLRALDQHEHDSDED